ncbi:MAG TPA: transcriptional regulator [Firmicutes bacterium]|nr:transcriptional regulator [Bacillota bacterium]
MTDQIKKRNRGFTAVYAIVILIVIARLVYIVDKNLSVDKTGRELPSGWQIIAEGYDVRSLAESGKIIWAGGKNGLVGIDKNSGEIIRDLTSDMEFSYVMALLSDESGALWIAHDKGLSVLKNGELTTWTVDDGLPSNHVKALGRDTDGKIWAGTVAGAVFQDGEKWTLVTSEDGLLVDHVNAILPDSRGGVWFGSYVAPRGGVSYLRDGNWQYFTRENGLPHPNVACFMEDDSGDVWIGTGLINRGGALKVTVEENRWRVSRTLTVDDGLAGEKVRSLCLDSFGGLWFGSEYDGVAVLINGGWKIFKQLDGLAYNEVTAIIESNSGDLWLGTLQGITRIKSRALREIHER